MDLNLLFQGLQAIGQIAAGVAAIWLVIFAYRYTKRREEAEHEYNKKRDKAEFLRNVWHDQCLINLHTLTSEDSLEQFEKIVYGPEYKEYDRHDARRRFHIFLMLNIIQNYFFAYQNGIIDKSEYEDHARRSLKLIKREERLVEYLVKQRGYTTEFADVIMDMMKRPDLKATPPRSVESNHLSHGD